jgi:cyclophilin family peptidyl-prolyl cis-trans isomerase/HEAT repeat protein
LTGVGAGRRASLLALFVVLCAAAAAACAGLGRPGAAEATRENRLSLVAGLLRVEDRREYDPLLVGRAAGSLDPWVRSRAALACGRLDDVEASIYLPVLLRDSDPSVRRAAAFASGVSGDQRLAPSLVASLDDRDPGTAAEAALALGRLGGADAEKALRSVLSGTGGPRASSALALFRSRDASLVPLLAVATAGEPELRRAAAWALARSPRPGSEEALRILLGDQDPESAAWAARGLGLLEDLPAAPRLVALAQGTEAGPAIQAFLALDRLAAKGPLAAEARRAGLGRIRDRHPGVAIAALTCLRRAAAEEEVREALAGVVTTGGRRAGVAVASLAVGDPGRAFAFAFPAGGAPLDLRLGAAEALPLLPAGELGRWLDALLADTAPRVRMEAVSRLPKESAAALASQLARALGDPDASVKAAALDAAAPIVSGPAAVAQVREAWSAAYASTLASREPDLVATALDAAASLGEGGRDLVSERKDDPDDLVRDRARRLLTTRFGEDPARFHPRAVATHRSSADYRRLARLAETGRVLATLSTTRGSFEAELLPREAPMTVESFSALARKGFFDGTTIHRVVPDFVVQAGDPRGDGTGGPGYALRDELNPLPYVRGRIGMALSGPDTGGSQWFVTLSRQPHLDAAYTVFGEVTSGMEVVERVEQNDRLLTVRVREEVREAPAGLAPGAR